MTWELLVEDGMKACRNPAAAPATEPCRSAWERVLSQVGFDAAKREQGLALSVDKIGNMFGPRAGAEDLTPDA